MASMLLDSRQVPASRVRPAVSFTSMQLPHTPLNPSTSTSTFNSPTTSFRIDDENLLVFDIGARVLKAGLSGESNPRCEMCYHPDQLRRVGDYRQYAAHYDASSCVRSSTHQDDFDPAYELWSLDLRAQDLSFLRERLDRLLKHVESTYLLLDSRPRKIALVASPQLPRALLEIVLSSLFSILQSPSITLFPSSVMSLVAAGLRSALVIDIGWSETAIHAVSEYREVLHKRSVRAAKSLVQAYRQFFKHKAHLTVEQAEDLLVRAGWCAQRPPDSKLDQTTIIVEQAGLERIELARNDLARPIDQILFTAGCGDHDLDDHDLPIHLLAYDVLLHVPLDVRMLCLPRIIVTGGLARLPGLKLRIIQELQHLVLTRGWTSVRSYGSASNKTRPKPETPPHDVLASASTMHEQPFLTQTSSSILTHLIPQEGDPTLAKIQSKKPTDTKPKTISAFHSLGAWAGASLVGAFRIKGLVQIEKERFLASGLTNISPRSSFGPRSGLSDRRTSWTLGIWA